MYCYCNHCPLVKRMQLTCTAWVESLNTRDDGRGKTYRSCQKLESISLHDLLSTGRHLLGMLFISSRKSNLCRTVTTQNTTESNCVMSRTKHERTSADCIFKWNTSVTGHKRGTIGCLTPAQTAKVNCKLRSQYLHYRLTASYVYSLEVMDLMSGFVLCIIV